MSCNPYRWFFPKPPPALTPLEVATGSFVAAQHSLLAELAEKERSTAAVVMLEGRIIRLRATIADLSHPEGNS